MATRTLDIVTARAVHLAMAPDFDAHAAADELVTISNGSAAVLDAALLRVDRALLERWSLVAERAADALRRAVAIAEHADTVAPAA